MKAKDVKKLKKLDNIYEGISLEAYQMEKRRLQLALLDLQQWIVQENKRLAIVFEGRDAAGKGSAIKRFTENLMPKYFRVVELGIPTKSESRNWFRRYHKHMPNPGEIVFFDRSWYTRAVTEPAMGYCTESQYKYFMHSVVNWEKKLIKSGINIIKFYLSVNKNNQLIRFEKRKNDPLKYWKFSPNDEKAREKWEIFTMYKNQMFEKTSAKFSPWVVVNSNRKMEARLTCMRYAITVFKHPQASQFIPLQQEKTSQKHSIIIDGVNFKNLSSKQAAVLKTLIASKKKTE